MEVKLEELSGKYIVKASTVTPAHLPFLWPLLVCLYSAHFILATVYLHLVQFSRPAALHLDKKQLFIVVGLQYPRYPTIGYLGQRTAQRSADCSSDISEWTAQRSADRSSDISKRTAQRSADRSSDIFERTAQRSDNRSSDITNS